VPVFAAVAGGQLSAAAAPTNSAFRVAATLVLLSAVGEGKLWAAAVAGRCADAKSVPVLMSTAVGGGAAVP